MDTPTLTESERQKLAQALDPEAQARAATAEQHGIATARAEAVLRAAQPEAHPQLEITKLFMRCGPRARREFLQDVKHIEPQLFAEIAEGAQ
jgi:hypothetical protein